MRDIVPIANINRRPPEAGRIRLGEKYGKAMRSISTFRFTSPHRSAIEKLAEIYGGTAEAWVDPAAPEGQWQVKTDSKAIEILVVPGGLSTKYEMWSGGGCQRRCDGIECEVVSKGPEPEPMLVPCICTKQGVAQCRPYTRLNVVLPNLDFYGVWRMETKGWNAAQELPGMYDMVAAYAERFRAGSASRPVRAMLRLEARTSKTNGQKKNFVVPTLTLEASPDELMLGSGDARPQLTVGEPDIEPERELTAGEPNTSDDEAADTEVVEAQVVDPALENLLEEQIRTIAQAHGLDEDSVVATIWQMTAGDYDKLGSFIIKSREGKTLSFTQKGTLKWTSAE